MSLTASTTILETYTAHDTPNQQIWLVRARSAADQDDDICVVQDEHSIVGPDGKTYQPSPFEIEPPIQTGNESPRLRLTTYLVTHELVAKLIDSAGTRSAILINAYLVQRGVLQSGSQTRHEAIRSFEDLEVERVSNQVVALTFEMTNRSFFDTRLTKYTFSPGRFRGLY